MQNENFKNISYGKQILNYEILNEKTDENRNCKIVDIRIYSGTTARLFIPIHTIEEETKIGEEITRAVFKMCFPNEDWSDTKLHILI